jgi:hypothetical protein
LLHGYSGIREESRACGDSCAWEFSICYRTLGAYPAVGNDSWNDRRQKKWLSRYLEISDIERYLLTIEFAASADASERLRLRVKQPQNWVTRFFFFLLSRLGNRLGRFSLLPETASQKWQGRQC